MEIASIILSSAVLIWSVISFFLLNHKQKQLNIIKDKLERTQYISNKQFDIEFEILREVSKQLIVLTDAYTWLYPPFLDRRFPVNKSKEEQQQYRFKIYNETIEESNKYRDILQSNAPFINAQLLKSLFNFRQKIHDVLIIYEIGTLDNNDKFIKEKEKEIGMNIYTYTEEIIEIKNNLIEDIREYFQTLKTI